MYGNVFVYVYASIYVCLCQFALLPSFESRTNDTIGGFVCPSDGHTRWKERKHVFLMPRLRWLVCVKRGGVVSPCAPARDDCISKLDI